MPIDYILLTLPCWEAYCSQRFDVFTDLSNHHLDVHEELLFGRGVDGWLAEWHPAPEMTPTRVVMPPSPDSTYWCTCGCLYEVHRGITAELPLQPCLNCGCRAFVLRLHRAAQLAPTPPTALDVFQAQCRDAGAPCQDLAASLLLERFGVSPGALAADCDAAIREAVARWAACAAPQGQPGPAPGWRWQTGSTDGHDYAHVETPECVEAGCRFIAGPKQA